MVILKVICKFKAKNKLKELIPSETKIYHKVRAIKTLHYWEGNTTAQKI